MTPRTYSPAGFKLTRSEEGLRLLSYKDPAGIWTVGYGHTGKDVFENLAISQAQVEILLRSDAEWL